MGASGRVPGPGGGPSHGAGDLVPLPLLWRRAGPCHGIGERRGALGGAGGGRDWLGPGGPGPQAPRRSVASRPPSTPKRTAWRASRNWRAEPPASCIGPPRARRAHGLYREAAPGFLRGAQAAEAVMSSLLRPLLNPCSAPGTHGPAGSPPGKVRCRSACSGNRSFRSQAQRIGRWAGHRP
jgi:hypothetical protein